jgi:hypothetical protein
MNEAEIKLQKIRGLLDVLENDLKEVKAILRGSKQ